MTLCIHCGKTYDADCHKSLLALSSAPRMDSHEYVPAPERIGKYLSVRKHPADQKLRTYRWTILTNQADSLGVVQWFQRWRQYCFDPCDGTTFNAGCLHDLAAFLKRINHEQREACAERKASDRK